MKAVGSNVVLKPHEPQREFGKITIAGMPSVLKNTWEQALDVVAVGPDVEGNVSEGDVVMIQVYTGKEFKYCDVPYVTVDEELIVARVPSGSGRVTCDARGHW